MFFLWLLFHGNIIPPANVTDVKKKGILVGIIIWQLVTAAAIADKNYLIVFD